MPVFFCVSYIYPKFRTGQNEQYSYTLNCAKSSRSMIYTDFLQSITKTCLCNIGPRKPHFYIVNVGFTGVNIISLISAQKHRLWVLVRTAASSRRGTIYTILVRMYFLYGQFFRHESQMVPSSVYRDFHCDLLISCQIV